MWIIWIGSVILGIVSLDSRPKIKDRLNKIVFFLLLLLMSCNNLCVDEGNILYAYKTGEFSSEVLIFNALMSIGRKTNMSFGVFNFITIGIALLLIANTLKHFTDHWGFVFGIFSLSSALLDTSLYRQFLASSVIVFSLRYLLIEKNLIKYCVTVLIAALIHTSLIVYLIFGIILLKKPSKIIYLLDLVVMAYIIATFLNGKVPPGIRLASSIINTGGRLDQYITGAAGEWGWLYPLSYFCLSLIISYTAWKSVSAEIAPVEKDILKMIVQINQISLIFMPLCLMVMVSFVRLYRPLIWLQLLTVALVKQGRKSKKTSQFHMVTVWIYSLWYFISFDFLIYDWNEAVMKILSGTMFFV